MHALIVVILYALALLRILIIVSAVLSWLLAFNVINFHNEFVRTVYNGLNALTEPLLRPIRRILPNLGGIDISPIIALLIILFAEQLIADNLLR